MCTTTTTTTTPWMGSELTHELQELEHWRKETAAALNFSLAVQTAPSLPHNHLEANITNASCVHGEHIPSVTDAELRRRRAGWGWVLHVSHAWCSRARGRGGCGWWHHSKALPQMVAL